MIEGFQVQALTSPGMSVMVGQGSARISTGTYPSSYGYFVGIDTTTGSPAGESVTITTASSSNPRIDTIVAYVDLSVTASSGTANNPNNMLKVAAVAGTPAGSPTAPSNSAIQTAIGASNPFIKLANVLVGTSVTQINSGNITDLRTWASTSAKNLFNPYKFGAYKSATSQTINTSATQVVFDVEEFDTGNNFASSAFTAPVAGFYSFSAAIQVTNNGSLTAASLFLYKNGTAFKSAATLASSATSTSVSVTAPCVQLAAGDVITVYAQGLGNAFACLNDPNYSRFSGCLVSTT